MKKIIFLMIIMSLCAMIWAHPKFMPFKVNPNKFIETRADSLHGFDVISYDISIKINDANHSISGAVITEINAESNLNSIEYNLISLTVDSVYVNDIPVNFTHTNGVISIPLNISNGTTFFTRVVYHGNPVLSNDGYGNGMTFLTNQVFTVSDPNAGRYWWPSYDHPWDKALVNLHVRVRSDWKVAANGIRQSIEQQADNTSTHHWIGSNPMATYLVSIAAAPYEEVNSSFQNIPLQNFVFPTQVTVAQTMFNKLPEMMQIYTDAYGPYPFEKYGNAVASISSFAAMEHQTMTTIGSSLINGSLSSDYTVTHELAHQWFGNCLTPLTWKDVWLSESFATYSEAVYAQGKYGYEAFCSYVQSSYH
nr:M1 family metallopeptidase [Candidatus Cloacimonadota bacterium]